MNMFIVAIVLLSIGSILPPYTSWSRFIKLWNRVSVVNTFGIYTGEKVGDEYGNVRLYAVVNFNNRDVTLESSSSFIYRLYSLV